MSSSHWRQVSCSEGVEFPRPTSVTEVRSFLGMLQYYARFLLSLSTILNSLNEVLQKNKHWTWTFQYETTFKLANKSFCRLMC